MILRLIPIVLKPPMVLPAMAETVGVSKSSVSQEVIEASKEELAGFDDVDILVICLDGLIFGDHHVLAAVGVNTTGRKHVLRVTEGASENQVVARGLLEELVRRGVQPGASVCL
jgi:hypothetical protein